MQSLPTARLQLPQPTFMGCIRGGGYDYDYENSNTVDKTASAIAKISDNNSNDDAANNRDKYISATATNSKGCRDSNGNNSSTSNDDGHEGWGELKEVQEVNTS
jgi:hypothetical protein